MDEPAHLILELGGAAQLRANETLNYAPSGCSGVLQHLCLAWPRPYSEVCLGERPAPLLPATVPTGHSAKDYPNALPSAGQMWG